jgi:hypothetical protein
MRNVLSLVLASLSLAAGCGGGDDTKSDGEGGMFILANFQLNGTQGIANCTIENQDDGSWVNDATVKINDAEIPFQAEGVYSAMKMDGTFATGDTLDLVIESSLGTATASGDIPESSSIQVDISGAAEGSVFNISH